MNFLHSSFLSAGGSERDDVAINHRKLTISRMLIRRREGGIHANPESGLGHFSHCWDARRLFPCLGSLNWINIPFSGIGLVVSVIGIATTKEEKKGGFVAGIVCCAIALILGLIRLIAGGGIF